MTIIDGYMFRRVAKPLLFVFLAFVGIFVLVDLFDHASKFIDNDVPISIVIQYYLYYMPWIVVLTAPVAMLLATLLSVGKLSRQNEVMAMKGSGLSLYRILAPILALAFLMSVAGLLVAEILLPPASRQRLEIKETHLRRSADQTIRTDVIYLRPDGTIFLARRFNVRKQTLEEITVEEFNDDSSPKMRIDATSGHWVGDHWVLQNGQVRNFTPDGERLENFELHDLAFAEPSPEDLRTRRLEPEELGYFDLRSYITKIRASGNDSTDLAVQLQLKLAFPFAILIMTLIGAPLAAGTRRSGFALAFTAALALSFVYFGLIQIGDVLGSQGILPPVLAAWMGNIVFGAIGVWLLARAPK